MATEILNGTVVGQITSRYSVYHDSSIGYGWEIVDAFEPDHRQESSELFDSLEEAVQDLTSKVGVFDDGS